MVPQKTKQEVMAEVISKSKQARAEKARLVSEQQQLIHTLDHDFSRVRSFMEFKEKGATKNSEELEVRGIRLSDPLHACAFVG